MNEANIRRITDPIAEYSDKSLQMTLADIGRKQALAAQERIVEAASERDRARELLRMATTLGIKIPKGATDEQVADLVRERKEEIAKNALTTTRNLFDKDRSAIESRRMDLESKRDKIINASLTPLQKAQLLKQILSQPEYVDAVRKEGRQELDKLLKMDLSNQTDADVEGVVSKIYSDIKNNKTLFFGKGGEKVANSFMDAYTTSAGEILSSTKQVDYAEWMQQMKDVTREAQEIERGRSDALKSVIRDHGAFLKPETIDAISGEVAPLNPEKPGVTGVKLEKPLSEAIDAVAKTTTETPIAKPPGQKWTGTIPTNAAPIAESITEGFVPTAGAAAADVATAIGNISRSLFTGAPQRPFILPDIGSKIGAGMDDFYRAPVSNKEIAYSKAVGMTNPQMMPIERLRAARKLLSEMDASKHEAIKQTAMKLGVTSDEIDAGDKLIQAGNLEDPATQRAIQSAMLILNMLSGNIGALPTVQDDARLAPLPQ